MRDSCPSIGPDLLFLRNSDRMDEEEGSSLSLSSIGGGGGVASKGGKRDRGCLSTNPQLKRGRRLQLLQMLALPFVPILALIVQNALTLRNIVVNRHEVVDIDRQVRKLSRLLLSPHTPETKNISCT
ncbi:Hypothetical predicted protein [Cloeon dipterum]|uniref:Uncharacterized protein n=1 Tax=Cloeon dipterum TaxID=197152 RepID=A0A8S1DZ15_9INSE|nr:Hypothetical predicted protein [Cloeon dipterum]